MLGFDSFQRQAELDTGQEAQAVRIISQPVIGNYSDTVNGIGTATAPTAQSAIVTIAATKLPAGVYCISAGFLQTGTADTSRPDNPRLSKQTMAGTATLGALIGILDLPNGSVLNVPVQATMPRVTLDGDSRLVLYVLTNATAGAVYDAWIQATRIG